MKRKNNVILLLCLVIVLIIIIAGGPIVINELYKKNNGYKTLWGAKDVFVYYGAVLSFVGTISLGVVTVHLSKQANDMNKSMLELQLSKTKPCLKPDLNFYDFYVGEDIYKQIDSVKVLKENSLLIKLLFTTEPRGELTTSIAALAVDFTNSGNSDIISVYIDKIDFRLSTKYNLIPFKTPCCFGNTNFKMNEKKKVVFE